MLDGTLQCWHRLKNHRLEKMSSIVTRGCCPLVTLLVTTVPSVRAETRRLCTPSMCASPAMAAICSSFRLCWTDPSSSESVGQLLAPSAGRNTAVMSTAATVASRRWLLQEESRGNKDMGRRGLTKLDTAGVEVH